MRGKYLWCGLFLWLSCCGGGVPASQEVNYLPPMTPGGRMCMDQCNKSRDYCRQSCDLDNRACVNDVQAAAQRDYDRYARDRFTAHAPVDLLPSDFEKLDVCIAEKRSCYNDCEHPYNACYKSCGGVVSVTTSCQFLCF